MPSPVWLQHILNKVEVEFGRDPQRYFRPSDEVVIPVVLKNTPKLHVRVFELNTASMLQVCRTCLHLCGGCPFPPPPPHLSASLLPASEL